MRDLIVLARSDLKTFWATLDHSHPLAVREAMERFYPDLVLAYGSAAASVAADRYDELRDVADVRARFRAVLGDVAPIGQVQASARWAISPLFGTNPNAAAALVALSGAAQRLIQQPARATIIRSVHADPASPRYARVPSGPHPCAFCLMLASRGAVYLTEESAGKGHDYHDDCWCEPEPVWSGQEPSYDVEELSTAYAKARADAGSSNPKAILSAMRQQQHIN